MSKTTILHCGHLIDGVSDSVLHNVSVFITGDTIASIVDTSSLQLQHHSLLSHITQIDLKEYTVLPGLFDAHCHPTIFSNDYQIKHISHSSAYKALRGLIALAKMLRCGWTSVRIAGEPDVFYGILDIKRCIDSGFFVGPRMTVAGHYLCITGGGGDLNFLSPEIKGCCGDGKVVDGVEQMRKAVREEIKYGSDWIKLMVTETFMNSTNTPVHFTSEELSTAVEEAKRLGKPVMAHAYSTEAIKAAVRAGVKSIEHGSFIDQEALDMMIKRDTYLVPTIFINQYMTGGNTSTSASNLTTTGTATEQQSTGGGSPSDAMFELKPEVLEQFHRSMRLAVKSGVKIALGTDYLGWDVELNARELQCLVLAGMTPMQAIKAATYSGASLFGWQHRLGSLEKGKLADIIAVKGNPLEDMSCMERVQFVMLGGTVVRDDQRGVDRFGMLGGGTTTGTGTTGLSKL